MGNYDEGQLGFIWLYNILAHDSTLAGLAPGGVNRGRAPAQGATPFVMMALQSGTDVTTMNGVRILDNLLYQVKVVGPASAQATIAQAAAQIDKLLGGPPGASASGNVTVNAVQEGHVYCCYRQSPLVLDEDVAGDIWTSMGGLYRIQIQEVAS